MNSKRIKFQKVEDFSKQSSYSLLMNQAFQFVKKEASNVFKSYNRYYVLSKRPEIFRVDEIIKLAEYTGRTEVEVFVIVSDEIKKNQKTDIEL